MSQPDEMLPNRREPIVNQRVLMYWDLPRGPPLNPPVDCLSQAGQAAAAAGPRRRLSHRRRGLRVRVHGHVARQAARREGVGVARAVPQVVGKRDGQLGVQKRQQALEVGCGARRSGGCKEQLSGRRQGGGSLGSSRGSRH